MKAKPNKYVGLNATPEEQQIVKSLKIKCMRKTDSDLIRFALLFLAKHYDKFAVVR